MKSAKLHTAIRTLLALAAASGFGRPGPALAQEALPSPAATDGAIEEIVVTGRQQTAAEQVLEERIQLDVVADIVGAEQIGRVGDSTVSLALRRLPAVTVVADNVTLEMLGGFGSDAARAVEGKASATVADSEASRLSAKRLENFKEVIGGADLP